MKFKFGKNVSDEFISSKLNINYKSYLKTSRKLSQRADINQNSCYICNSKESIKVCEFYGIQYRKCKNCTHLYANKRLSQQKLNEFYTKNKEYSAVTYANKKLMKIREDIFEPKIKFVKEFVNKKKWLDVGSADGAALTAISKNGFTCQGIEISENSRKFAKKFRSIDLYPNPLSIFVQEKKIIWDIISYFGVLHHLSDPISELKICNRLLKKDGIIVIDGPNSESISSYIQQYSGIADRHLVPYSHIMLFSLKSLKYALKKTGFKPIAVWFYGMDMIEFLKYMIRFNKKFQQSKVFMFLKDNLNNFQKIIDEQQKSDFFLVVAKKIK